MLRTTLLRPGLLVGLKTAIKGDNVDYTKTVLEEEHTNDNGELVGSWQTDKVVVDAAEHERAVKVRSKARNLVTSICAKTDFGLLCPADKAPLLEAALKEGAELCIAFNESASLTEIVFSSLTGTIAVNDAQAIRAIKGELAGLLEEMDKGVKALDVDATRLAANKAKQLGSMLSPDVQASLQKYIKDIRKVATEINKAGDQAAEVLNEEVLKGLALARTAFLDLDGMAEVQETVVEGRAVDLDPDVPSPVAETSADETEIDIFGEDEPLTTPSDASAPELDLDDIL